MLKTLKFVQGAIAKKDFVPALTHFHIRDGYVLGYNGRLALCSPIQLDLAATPEGIPFVKAIATCEEEVALSLTDNGRLAVRSGPFKAFIRCTQDPYPDIRPEGEFYEMDGNLLEGLRKLQPFISEDASRPWSQGVLFDRHSAYATNNVILTEFWLGYRVPKRINVPRTAVNELLRIGEEPLAMQANENSATFYYGGNRWLKTQLYSLEWPDVERILNFQALHKPVPQGLWKALHAMTAFVGEEGRVYLSPAGVATLSDFTATDGASVELPLPGVNACFNLQQLLRLEEIAESLDLPDSLEPRPCLFFGKSLRGAIMGMRR